MKQKQFDTIMKRHNFVPGTKQGAVCQVLLGDDGNFRQMLMTEAKDGIITCEVIMNSDLAGLETQSLYFDMAAVRAISVEKVLNEDETKQFLTDQLKIAKASKQHNHLPPELQAIFGNGEISVVKQ